MRALTQLGLEFSVLVQDVQANIDAERTSNQAGKDASWYDVYHPYDEIVDHLRQLAAGYPKIVSLIESVGPSIEGRRIPALRITSSENRLKTRVYFQGGQHAREWIGPATTMYILEKLITLYNIDDEITYILDNVDFYVVPVVNPDGYNYTWSTNRNWRKNRRPNGGNIFGVDLNRNWDDHWSLIGSSNNPSSDTFHGTAPFSESETYFVSRFILANGPFDGAIDFHSYGQLVLRPYGYSTAVPPNDVEAKKVGDQWAADVALISGKLYVSQPWWQMYFASGTADDWWHGQAGARLSYTVELRDTGTYGFQLPANQIIPTGEENWYAFKGFVNYLLQN